MNRGAWAQAYHNAVFILVIGGFTLGAAIFTLVTLGVLANQLFLHRWQTSWQDFLISLGGTAICYLGIAMALLIRKILQWFLDERYPAA